MNVLQFIQQNHTEVLELTAEHLWLVGASIALAVLIGIPLGILITRWPVLGKPVLGGANIIQTIPSLALFGFLLPAPWIGARADRLAILALTLTYGAYVSEVYRAGIESVHWSQTAAARSLGLSYTQTMRHVVVPQAVRRVIPPLLNDFIGLQKDTSLIGALGVLDVVSRARFVNNSKGTLTAYSMGAILFLLVTIPFTRWLDWLIRRQQAKTLAGR